MKTAVMVVDVQTSLVDRGIWRAAQVIESLNSLTARARQAGIPVFFIRDQDVAPDNSIHSGLVRTEDDAEILKLYSSAFDRTSLQSQLQLLGITRLVIGGMQSEHCVNAAVEDAINRGFEVVLVSDAHSTLDTPEAMAEEIVASKNRDYAQLGPQVQVLPSHRVTF